MSYRVAKIREHSYPEWDYVPTRNTPADLGSPGCEPSKRFQIWWDRPEWLGDCKNWPEQLNITNSDKSDIERKKVKELLTTTVDLPNPIDKII